MIERMLDRIEDIALCWLNDDTPDRFDDILQCIFFSGITVAGFIIALPLTIASWIKRGIVWIANGLTGG